MHVLVNVGTPERAPNPPSLSEDSARRSAGVLCFVQDAWPLRKDDTPSPMAQV